MVDAQEKDSLLKHQKPVYKLGLLNKLKLHLYTRCRNLNKCRWLKSQGFWCENAEMRAFVFKRILDVGGLVSMAHHTHEFLGARDKVSLSASPNQLQLEV